MSLITAITAVLVAVTDHVGGETQSVTTAVVPGLDLGYVETQAPVGLAWGHRPGHSAETLTGYTGTEWSTPVVRDHDAAPPAGS